MVGYWWVKTTKAIIAICGPETYLLASFITWRIIAAPFLKCNWQGALGVDAKEVVHMVPNMETGD